MWTVFSEQFVAKVVVACKKTVRMLPVLPDDAGLLFAAVLNAADAERKLLLLVDFLRKAGIVADAVLEYFGRSDS